MLADYIKLTASQEIFYNVLKINLYKLSYLYCL